MATRNRFGAFTCALKLVSKRFETGLTKPALHQVSLETVLQNRFRSAKKWRSKAAYGDNISRDLERT